MSLNKRWITHGIWKDFNARTRKGDIYIPMPLKLRDLLQKKAYKFKLDVVEFTYGRIPERHIGVLAIVHPLDRFVRKIGIKIVNERLDWAEKLDDQGFDINHKQWAYKLKNHGT